MCWPSIKSWKSSGGCWCYNTDTTLSFTHSIVPVLSTQSATSSNPNPNHQKVDSAPTPMVISGTNKYPQHLPKESKSAGLPLISLFNITAVPNGSINVLVVIRLLLVVSYSTPIRHSAVPFLSITSVSPKCTEWIPVAIQCFLAS